MSTPTYTKELESELFSGIAHDLKNPLTKLLLATELHLKKMHANGFSTFTAKELVSIKHELLRMNRLIDDALSDEKMKNGKFKITLEYVNLVTVVKEIVTNMPKIYYKHDIKFKNTAGNKVMLYLDPLRFEQVLVNLISNACKNSEDNSEILVGIRKNANYVYVYVKDHGIGIPKEKQKLIFNRYYQIHEHKEGLGLGLYIAEQIVKSHKGKLWVNSQEHHGSTFNIRLQTA